MTRDEMKKLGKILKPNLSAEIKLMEDRAVSYTSCRSCGRTLRIPNMTEVVCECGAKTYGWIEP